MVLLPLLMILFKKRGIATVALLFLGQFVFAQPAITGINPTSAVTGAAMTITGSGFNTTASNNMVFFGAVRATVSVATGSSLTVTVPSGALYGPVTVLNMGTGLSVNSGQFFNPVYTPAKTGFAAADLTAKADMAATTAPYAIAIGDFDGDGKPDVITANQTSSNISVFLNTSTAGGTPSFATQQDFATGPTPRSVYVGDLDGDGKPDVVTANVGDNTVSVLRNISSGNGNISFAAAQNLGANTGAQYVSIGDLDGDGKQDIAVTCATAGKLTIFLNTSSGSGNISFAPKQDFTTGNSPNALVLGDLDKDGKTDLGIVNAGDNNVSVFLNTSSGSGNISFAARQNFAVGTFPRVIAIGDLDGDGKLDLAVSNQLSDNVSVLRNTSTGNGNIGFAGSQDFTTGARPLSVTIGDMDGDGKADMAATNLNSTTVSVFRNTSTGTGNIGFAAKQDFTTGTSPFLVAIGDLNADGQPDMAVNNRDANTVSIYRNTSSNARLSALTATAGTLTPVFTAGTLSYTAVVSAGTTTITVMPASEESHANISVRVNSGTYTTVTSGNTSPSLGINNGSNLVEIAVTAENGVISQTYSLVVTRSVPVISSITPTAAIAGATVTITGSGFNTTASNNIVFFGNIRATVGSASASTLVVTVPSGALYGPVKVLNTGSGLSGSSSQLFNPVYTPSKSGFTTGDLASKVNFTAGANANYMATGDLDGDGKQDLVTLNYNASSFSVLRNTYSGSTISYAGKQDFTIAVANPTNVAVHDIDGDGKPDVVIGNSSGFGISVFRNTSSGTGNINFAAEVNFGYGSPYAFAIGDLDGDGKPDLAVTNTGVTIFRNLSTVGTISFSSGSDITTTGTPISIEMGDLDGDGKTDLAVSKTNSTIGVFRNISLGSISFATEQAFATNVNPLSVKLADLDGDGKTDLSLVNSTSQNISVLRNTSSGIGNINFASKQDLALGTGARSVAVGDMDGDGKPDLVAQGTLNLFVFRNTSAGAISFASRQNFTLDFTPFAINIADMNGDGLPDLALSDDVANVVSILRNTSGNARLSALTITAGTLSPVFGAATLTYTSNVSAGTTTMTVTPTKEAGNATIAVRINNGSFTTVTSGSASPVLSINNGSNPIEIKVTAENGTTSQTYIVTVSKAVPSITATGTLTALTGIYGTVSASASFTVSGTDMQGPIIVTPPAGFEVSADNSVFSSTVSIGAAGTISSTAVYLRLKGSVPAGNYSGNIVLSSLGATALNITTVASIVNAKPLTISGVTVSNKVYDGTITATLSGIPALNGIVGADDVSIGGTATANFSTVSVGAGKSITVTGYTLSGSAAGNYIVIQPTGLTADITARTLTVSGIIINNKTYDGNTSATLSGTLVLNGIAGTDDVNIDGTATANFSSASVGAGKTVTVTGYTLSGLAAGNYTLTQPAGLTADITAKTLTIAGIAANNKTYDGNTAATVSGTPVLNGVVGTDDVSIGVAISAGFATASVGTAKSITVTGYTLNGTAAGNYTLTQPAGLTADITAKTLTISGIAANNKTYDGNTAATVSGTPVLNGVAGTDDVSIGGTISAGFANASVGTAKTITATGYTLNGTAAGNYTLAQPVGLTADITAKTITVSGIAANNKIYDGNTSATVSGTPVLNGVIGTDNVTIGGIVAGVFANASVGNAKAVTITGYALSGTAAANYTLTQPSGLTAAITPKTLAISGVTAVDKIYDGNTAATVSGTPVLNGVVGADNITISGTAVATFANASAGTSKPVTITGYVLNGAAAGNYLLTQPSGITANINTKALTISGITANNKTFDGNTTATFSGTPVLNGVVGSDNVNVNGTAVASFADAIVGTNKTVTVTGFTLGGAASGNYTLTLPVVLSADITATATGSSPVVTVSGTPGNFTTCAGTASASQNISISGTFLTGAITVTASNGYELSLTPGGPYTSSVLLQSAGGSVAATVVYVRLSQLTAGTQTGSITISTTGTVSQQVALSGTVNVVPTVTASANPNPVAKGLTATLFATATNATKYAWSPSANLTDATLPTTTARITATTTYTITATSAAGCTAAAAVTVTSHDGLDQIVVVPLVYFSPNGDGINDFFVIQNLDMYPDNLLQIFDRNGKKLFEQKHYDNKWDGKINGVRLVPDTYFYILTIGWNIVKKGTVTIVK